MFRARSILPGEIPEPWNLSTECQCKRTSPRSNSSQYSSSSLFKTVKTTLKLTRYIFGPFDYASDAEATFEEEGTGPPGTLAPTVRSARLLMSFPPEILGLILDQVISASTASDALCKCRYPGTNPSEIKQRHLRSRIIDTKNVRETCSKWHSWVSAEYFSGRRRGLVVDLSDVDALRWRLVRANKRFQEEDEERENEESSDEDYFSEYESDDDASEHEHSRHEERASREELHEGGGKRSSSGGGKNRKKKRKPRKSISAFLSSLLLPEGYGSSTSLTSTRSLVRPIDWTVVHKFLLLGFPHLKSGGITAYLGSPLEISNLRCVQALFASAPIWCETLLQNGGGLLFWDATYAVRDDMNIYQRLMEDPAIRGERLLKYYDNPEREFWGLDEAMWIMNPERRSSGITGVAIQREQQRYALSRKVHEFLVEVNLEIIKSDAKVLLDLISLVPGVSFLQFPINILAVLKPSEWLPILQSSLMRCKRVEFKEWTYCNQSQFSNLIAQLSGQGYEDDSRGLPRDIWWTALLATRNQVNWEVDVLMEESWQKFQELTFDQCKEQESAVQDIILKGRAWERFENLNFIPGMRGKGRQRRWLDENFTKRLVLGISEDKSTVKGLEKFTVGDGCWAAELSIGATLNLLQQSFSADTLRSLDYRPAIPQLSMAAKVSAIQHHCPLLSQFPNLTDLNMYSVCCLELFTGFSRDIKYGNAPRKWRITVPRVLKSFARGCRDVSQEEESFRIPGPRDDAHEQLKAEWLLKTPAWGLAWTPVTLKSLLDSAREARDIVAPTPATWDLEITFEGMVAVEAPAYISGPSGADGLHGRRYVGFEGYVGLFPDLPKADLEHKETTFFPLRDSPEVQITARDVSKMENEFNEEGLLKILRQEQEFLEDGFMG